MARATSDPDATLEIVGKPVIASYASALYRLVFEAGLQQAITFRGHASDADLAAAYARADVLVVASGHEGFGVPPVEAMSVGLPIVYSSAGALPEVVGDAGVVTDTEDPWALAGTIAELLGDIPRLDALAAAARSATAGTRSRDGRRSVGRPGVRVALNHHSSAAAPPRSPAISVGALTSG